MSDQRILMNCITRTPCDERRDPRGRVFVGETPGGWRYFALASDADAARAAVRRCWVWVGGVPGAC